MLNQLIYGDIKNASGSGGGSAPYDDAPYFPGDEYPDGGGSPEDVVPNELLHGRNGRLIYSDNFAVWAQWAFSQSGENLCPAVLINGKVECNQHSTSHIIAHRIKKTSGTETIRLSMKSSGKDCKWNGGASCTYRLWGGSKTFSTSGGHGAEKSGTCGGGASFTVTIYGSGDYRIS